MKNKSIAIIVLILIGSLNLCYGQFFVQPITQYPPIISEPLKEIKDSVFIQVSTLISIDETGMVYDLSFKEVICYPCDSGLVKQSLFKSKETVYKMQPFKKAIQNGQPIKVKYIQPFNFRYPKKK